MSRKVTFWSRDTSCRCFRHTLWWNGTSWLSSQDISCDGMCTLDATSHFVEPWSVRIFFCCFLVCYWPPVAIVVANEGQRIDIPDSCILENRLLSGNLNMIVRPISSTTYHSSNEIYLGSLISSAQDSIYGHFVVFHWTITFSVSPYFLLDPIHVASLI